MQRFYISNLNTINFTFVLLDEWIIYQLIKVLRIKVWEKLIFFDWIDEYDYIFEIKQINKKDIVLEQIWREYKKTEIDFELNLYQSIPNKFEKIEYIIQKWVEVWIKNFIFFRSQRSQKLFITDNKIERLNKILSESVEQSGRNYKPELIFLDKINFWDLVNDENIFFHTENKDSFLLKELNLDYKKNINIFVWPEWGFNESENILFEKFGFKRVYLWDRILRTETVGIVSSFYIINSK